MSLMARPEYSPVLTERGVKLLSPTGELIISTYSVYGSSKPKYIDHFGLELDLVKLRDSHSQDEIFKLAASKHERMTTTRRQRFRWSAGKVLRSPALWSALGVIVAAVAAFGAT